MGWWQGLRSLRRGKRPSLTLHHFGVDDQALSQLVPMLARLSRELTADLRLGAGAGDVVLVDDVVSQQLPPQVLQSFCAKRPCIKLKREAAVAGAVRGAIAYAALRQQLLAEIARIHGSYAAGGAAAAAGAAGTGSVSGAAGESEFDSGFDSRLPSAQGGNPFEPAQARMLKAILRGRAVLGTAPIVVGYGPRASLRFDFDQWRVQGDPLAWAALRLERRLPAPVAVSEAGTGPSPYAESRPLGAVLWELGLAAGRFDLHDAPGDWWHVPLSPVRLDMVAGCTSLPLHREMVHVLQRGGVTPSQLRRECRAGVRELRAFLQACLLLGLVSWAS